MLPSMQKIDMVEQYSYYNDTWFFVLLKGIWLPADFVK